MSKFKELVLARVKREREDTQRRKDAVNPFVDRETSNKEASELFLKEAEEKRHAEAESINAVLNAEQRKAWTRMIGEPFNWFDRSSR